MMMCSSDGAPPFPRMLCKGALISHKGIKRGSASEHAGIYLGSKREWGKRKLFQEHVSKSSTSLLFYGINKTR